MGIQYRELPIDPALQPYVRLIWTLEVEGIAAFGAPERILPDGGVEVIFHYGKPFDMRYAGEAFSRQPTASVVSQTRRYVEIRPSGPSGFMSVRFHRWGARHFIDVPLNELADRLDACGSDLGA